MPAHVLLEDGVHRAGRVDRVTEQAGCQDAHDRRPGGVEGLRRIVREVIDDTLAPHLHAGGVEELAEDDASFAHLATRDPEGLAEREADLAEEDAIEADHEVSK
ncbi:hypothetical protein D3C83_30090 [compost metagenome]